MTTPDEIRITLFQAEAHGVDAAFLRALDHTEGLPKGPTWARFGVAKKDLPTHLPEFDGAACVAAATIRNFVLNDDRNPFHPHTESAFRDGRQFWRSRYRPEFVQDFSHHYAPIGVENDPTNLNVNHARNLEYWYGRFILNGPEWEP